MRGVLRARMPEISARVAAIGLIAVIALAAGCGEGPRTAPAVGDRVPDYGARTLDSDSASLDDLRGQVVLLNVWATWCPPCREEIPVLQALHEEHADEGLRVVGVSVDASGEETAIERFVENFGVTFDIWHDPQERVSSTFRTTGVPTTLLIGRDGRLLWRHLGPVRLDDQAMQAQIAAALEG